MRSIHFSLLLFFLLPVSISRAQEEAAENDSEAFPIGLPVKLDISRRQLKNFLTDTVALGPYRIDDGTARDFSGAFTIGSPNARFVAIWDPESCRLVGVLDLLESGETSQKQEPTTPYSLLAEGMIPTAVLPGANGDPRYFGMRLVDGKPEFLYTHGAHAIAEMIWLEDDGEILKQRFSFRKAPKGIKLSFPESWIPKILAETGEWNGAVLSIDGEERTEITLLYRLNTTPAEVAE